ncbi:sugar transporter ERD6-like 9 [Harmonia axyridis]|uniref:sugar transporter ERD6-like 9 n=1 Tax=Harmonia axyridis TaxID=115357 RepID=UPI001E276F2D|nr:sugar transporter ERD6-like 9 [Harmonia axyridis]XP_045476699.1 sugar transporter ERD6-like 9 [Harmonia axyridis]XP_045476700.1 sugar transporter ERD6-like 9 [Harmonia axyridis]XP_045476701.1 sugar transporter ERD6-like 9 [Harmonia axyridis]
MAGSREKSDVDERIEEFVHVLHVMNHQGVEQKHRSKWRQKFWQIFPSVCASLLAIPFGIMLGWPSAAYPYLLEETSVIPISLSQSAMIAGFFMLGITTATPFSTKYHMGPKYGIWISMALFTLGWTLMWYSSNIFWLLGSRYTAGLGGGYGFGQVRAYIRDMCEPNLSAILLKQLNFYGFFGTIAAFTMNLFLDYRGFSLIALIISAVILFVTFFLPSTPKDFIKANRIDDALILLNYLRGKADHTEEIKDIHRKLSTKDEPFLIPILKDKKLRIKLIKFVLLVFLQQFSGAPTSFVYCQLIFDKSGCPFPEYCAVLYAIIFFTSNVYGVFYSPNFNKKRVLIYSSLSSTAMLVCQVLVLYFEVNQKWQYTSLFVMSLFVTFYSLGVGCISSTYISEWFPQKYHRGLSNLFTMEFFMCALVATKTFQVFMSSYPLYVGFFMFITADTLLLLFAMIFLKSNSGNRRNNLRANGSNFLNIQREKV